jgi:hypothetical protein
MFMLMPVIVAVVLVFFGYLAVWTASHKDIPAGISKFGKILSIILYVFAGLVIIFSVTCRPPFMGQGRGMMKNMGPNSCMQSGQPMMKGMQHGIMDKSGKRMGMGMKGEDEQMNSPFEQNDMPEQMPPKR